jgi:hypothetical protein
MQKGGNIPDRLNRFTHEFPRPFKIAFALGRNPDPNYQQMEYACVEGEKGLQHYTNPTERRKITGPSAFICVYPRPT